MALKNNIIALNMFMEENDIPYILTGTSALAVHGLLPDGYEPHDIDIIICFGKSVNYDEVVKKLKSLQRLSGIKDANYDESKMKVFTFNVAKMNVNAFVNKEAHICSRNTYIGAFGENGAYTRILINNECVKVSSVMDILKAKFGLKRNKDYKFAKDLASTILNL